MKVIVSGASGLIGTALVSALRDEGCAVVRLVRRAPSAPEEARWEPKTRSVDSAALEGADAVVHLAGAGVADGLWTKAYKEELRNSRILGTGTLADALAALKSPPRVFVSGSAVGFYGDTADRETTEEAPRGAGFLAQLSQDWEAAAQPAADAGIRVVHPRTGIVLTTKGGILGKMLPAFKLGLGARFGNGRQWMSWISLRDEVAALRFLIDSDLAGPVNLTAPLPVTNAELTRTVAKALHRPAPLAVPAAVLRLAPGGFGEEGALISQRILPSRLLAAGFGFQDPALAPALTHLLPA
ncbi:MAG: TIGR01777 family oxidoreductase [Streptosporangiaceae bacterium]